MRMDAAALRAVHVLRQRKDPNDTFSRFGLMNKSPTPMGKRLLLRWLKQPLLDVAAINERHDVVEAMYVPPYTFTLSLACIRSFAVCAAFVG